MAEDCKHAPPLVQRLQQMLEPVVEGCGLELVELQFRREASGWVLRLIIDREGGVSVDDCADVSRETGHLLEVEDPIEQAYTLEVSSPGLDRPLKRLRDFERCVGKKAKVVTREAVDGQFALTGIIDGVGQGVISLDAGQGPVSIPFDIIKKARLVVEF
ncbi:MAG: ribosome maturation factor RimP [Thermodesulfobacteriota bacterium]